RPGPLSEALRDLSRRDRAWRRSDGQAARPADVEGAVRPHGRRRAELDDRRRGVLEGVGRLPERAAGDHARVQDARPRSRGPLEDRPVGADAGPRPGSGPMRARRTAAVVLAMAALGSAGARADEWEAPAADKARANPVSPSPEALAKGRALYQKHCAMC